VNLKLVAGVLGICLITGRSALGGGATTEPSPDARFVVREELFHDDFKDLSQWYPELEKGGTVQAKEGAIQIDVPAGCTVWFKPRLDGPVMIEYEATVLKADGPNDRVSDLNCFWMSRDARSPEDVFATKRSGKFSEYNQLKCYYVGLGGNGNTTTRFRRYIGDEKLRPILPKHDLSAKEFMITANISQTIRLVACDKVIQFYRDDRRIFEMEDPEAYDSGWFAFRTTANHMSVRNFKVHRLKPAG